MRAELKIKKDGVFTTVKLHNTLTFDHRLDEELDGGSAAAFISKSEEMAEFTEAMLTLVDDTGVRGKITNWLTDEEVDKLKASANKLKEIISQIKY